MSALGHKRTYAVQNGMSALPPKADIKVPDGHVCFGPLANISPYSITHSLPGCVVIPRFPKSAPAHRSTVWNYGLT